MTDTGERVSQEAREEVARIIYAVFPAAMALGDGGGSYSWHSAVAKDLPEIEIAYGTAEAIVARLAQQTSPEVARLRQADPYAHADGSRECRPVARKADPEVTRLRDLLVSSRDTLLREVVHMEQDWPGDVTVDCGWWCRLCNDHVEGDRPTGPAMKGHVESCLIEKICAALADTSHD